MTVQVLGDFTHWQQNPINLKNGEDGTWRTVVELPPGEHHYRFMVDGHWRDDPECVLRGPNPHGSEKMVRRLARALYLDHPRTTGPAPASPW
jgi:1,4-alpha-glucan branching enzyme